MIWSPLSGLTVLSALPWNTMVGMTKASFSSAWASFASLAAFALPAAARPLRAPRRIAEKAEITSVAAPGGKPECTPTAANSSGYSPAMMAAIAPPADSPAM